MKILLLAVSACALATSSLAAEPQRTGPQLIGKYNIKYPVSELANHREALVNLRIRIGADGNIIEADVGPGGFHNPSFVDAALKGIHGAKYKPATEGGVATETTAILPISFSIEGSHGITPAFRAELNKVDAFLKARDFAGAHFHAEWMLAEKTSLLYEFAALNAQLAQTHAAIGNVHRALRAAQTATAAKGGMQDATFGRPARRNPSKYMLPEPIIVDLLKLRTRLAASQGLLADAWIAYIELISLTPLPPESPYAKLGASIEKDLRSDRTLVGKISISESRHWFHVPFRRSFSIGALNGEIKEIVLDCVGKRRTLDYKADATWTIPAKWEKCSLQFEAEPDTEFEILEAGEPLNQLLVSQP